jgi:aspartate racemase
MVADIVQQNIQIPLINIAEVTANEIVNHKINKVALLGTKFTMEQPFFKQKLTNYNIETLIPKDNERDFIHASIFTELGKGIFKEETKNEYLGIIESLINEGAEGVIFACTEIPMLITQSECAIKIFDTTAIHSKAAVEYAIT